MSAADLTATIRQIEGLAPRRAVQLQQELRHTVRLRPLKTVPRLLAGADVSYKRGDTHLYAAVVVWDRTTGEILETTGVKRVPHMPYIPGLLSFREVPSVLLAFQRLQNKPGLLICDGQGLAHPRRFGLACHLGILLKIPTVGCAKTRLCGTHREPANSRGSKTKLYDGKEQIGTVLRTRDAVKPVYVSPGHLCDFTGAESVVLAAATRYRLCDPIRMAHNTVNAMRRQDARNDIHPDR
ncbi:MAG: endonuclease V [Leptospiraceae bacterium]|nr:endonuclease V [Leptospiraceae bacterium]